MTHSALDGLGSLGQADQQLGLEGGRINGLIDSQPADS